MKIDYLKGNVHELKDSFYLMLLQGVNQFVPLLVLPYLMCVLGAEGYGYVGFALSLVQVVTLVVDFGFDLSATKHVAMVCHDRAELGKVFWNVVASKCLLLSFSLAVLMCVAFCVPSFEPYRLALWVTVPMAVGSAFSYMWFFQGIGKICVYSVLNTLSKVVLLPLVFLFVKSPSDYVWATLFQSSVFLFTAIVTNLYLWRCKSIPWACPVWQGMRKELADSFPLFLSKASTSVYIQLFVVILGFYCTTEAIGRYTAAERIMRAVCFVLLVPVSQAFFPKVARLSKKDNQEAVKVFNLALLLVAVIMSGVFAILFLGSEYVSFWLGEGYEGLDGLMRIFAWAPLAIGLGCVYGQLGLVGMGGRAERKCFRNVYFFAAIFSLVAIFCLVSQWKEYGAAWGVVLSEGLICVLMCFYFYRRIKIC